MIVKLKTYLNNLQELESYAYASGEGDVPSTLILERQKVVMGKKCQSPRKSYFQSKICITFDYRAT